MSIVVFDADHPEGESALILNRDLNNKTITLDRRLSNNYKAGYGTGGKGAAVGRPGGGYYEADMGGLTQAYGNNTEGTDGGCFVEFISLSDGAGYVPLKEFLNNETNPSTRAYHDLWFKNKDKANHIHLIAAKYRNSITDPTTGLTNAAMDYSYIYVKKIELLFPTATATAIQSITAHELGHQFSLAETDAVHPDNWCHLGTGTDHCIMSYEDDVTDQYIEFCHDAPNHVDAVRDAVNGL